MTHAKLHTRVKKKLADIGFTHSKQFQYGRIVNGVVQYIVLSKHRQVGDYDLSCGIRLPGSTFPALAMIGPTSGPADQILDGKIQFRAVVCWARVSPTIDDCAEKIGQLVRDHQLEWLDNQTGLVANDYTKSDLIDDDKLLMDNGNWRNTSAETANEFKLDVDDIECWNKNAYNAVGQWN